MKTFMVCGKFSGKATGYCAVFPICLFLFVYLFKQESLKQPWTPIETLGYLVLYLATIKGVSEWYFWSSYNLILKKKDDLKNWHKFVGKTLLTQPYILFALFLVLADILIDFTLLNEAIKLSSTPVLTLLIFSCCQGIGSFLSGPVFDSYGKHQPFYDARRRILTLSLGLGLIALALARQVGSAPADPSPYSLLPYFFLDKLSPSLQMLIILYGKGLLANTFPLARAVIAEGIQIEILREQKTQ